MCTPTNVCEYFKRCFKWRILGKETSLKVLVRDIDVYFYAIDHELIKKLNRTPHRNKKNEVSFWRTPIHSLTTFIQD